MRKPDVEIERRQGRGNTFPPHPLCPDCMLCQRADHEKIFNTICQLPYFSLKTVQRYGSTLLMVDWNLAVEGQQVFQIDPLR